MWNFEKLYAELFFCFFVIEILSPSVGDKTIYIVWIIAFTNVFFWNWLREKRITFRFCMLLVCLGFIAVFGHATTLIKLVINLFGMIYLNYIYECNLWKLANYLIVSILVAIAQFTLMFFNPEASIALGPKALSETIWGAYALKANTNFYDAFDLGIIRVSGLSREAGFFASLLATSIIFYYLSFRKIRHSKFFLLLVVMGYIVSFSKMSLTVILAWIAILFRKFINKIPFGFIGMGYVLLSVLFWKWNVLFLLEDANITFLDRFGAFVTLLDLSFSQFVFGANVDNIDSYIAYLEKIISPNDWFAGMGGWVVYNGILAYACWLLLIYYLGVSSTGLLVLIILTINVQPDTNQCYVVLAYFTVWKFLNRRKIIKEY